MYMRTHARQKIAIEVQNLTNRKVDFNSILHNRQPITIPKLLLRYKILRGGIAAIVVRLTQQSCRLLIQMQPARVKKCRKDCLPCVLQVRYAE